MDDLADEGQDDKDRDRLRAVTSELHALLDRLEGKSAAPLVGAKRSAAEARVWELADEVTRIALIRQESKEGSRSS